MRSGEDSSHQARVGGKEDERCLLSLVIPCYNEANRLGQTLDTLKRWCATPAGRDCELILVDDGSVDETWDLLQSKRWSGVKCLRNHANRGKGYSVKQGVLAAQGTYVFYTDADLPFSTDTFHRFLPWLVSGYDLAIGDRTSADSRFQTPVSRLRRLASKVFTFIIVHFVVKGIADTQCGFKGFKRTVALDLFSRARINGYGFDVEILRMAQKKPYAIKRLPVRLINNTDSRVRVFRDGLRMLRDIVAIYLREMLTRHD